MARPRFIWSPATRGVLYGMLGVCSFSLTLPATRIAIADLDPTVVGLGRALVAAILAAILLLVTRQPWPSRAQFHSLALVAAGVVVGFPLLSAWALQAVPANHGAIMLGVLPLATAIAGVIRAGDRPSPGFWVAAIAGSTTVIAFALISGGGRVQMPDLALLGAVVAAAVGYAEGGRLARTLGSWQVICWALVLVAPVLVVPIMLRVAAHGMDATPRGWLGFAYLSLVSMFLGFFAWYRGLALGGVARVGQIQLLQPFLTIAASHVLLGEPITPMMMVAACVVVVIVVLGRRAVVVQQSTHGHSTETRSTAA